MNPVVVRIRRLRRGRLLPRLLPVRDSHLGGFVGPWLVGAMSGWTGSLSRALALAGLPLFVSGALLLLLPDRAGRRGA